MRPKPASLPDGPSPARSAVEDLEYVRAAFRDLVERYAANVEGDIARIRTLILEQGNPPPAAVQRDLREISGLARRLDIRPEKGRRKDLRKVEQLARDVLDLAEGW